MNGKTVLSSGFVLVWVLGPLLAAGVHAQAAMVVDFAVGLESLEGEVSNATGEIVEGSDREGAATAALGSSFVTASGTFLQPPIDTYVSRFSEAMNSVVTQWGDTRWASKIGVDFHLDALMYTAQSGPAGFTRDRTTEKYAAFAIAPNSASGFAPINDGVSSIDLFYNVQFFSDSQPLDFENNLFAPFGSGPYLDFSGGFHDVLLDFNQGHILVVDLDAVGVGPGDWWGFVETIRMKNVGLQIIGGPTGIPQEAFVVFDPVVGFAEAVPEPSTIILLLTGALGLLIYACRRRRRTV
jgi:hypothetical protein